MLLLSVTLPAGSLHEIKVIRVKTYHVPGIVLNALHTQCHVFLARALRRRDANYLPFIELETEAQRTWETCPESHGQ